MRSLYYTKNRFFYFNIRAFNIKNIKNPLIFFNYHFRTYIIAGNITSMLHFIIMLSLLIFGEFFFFAVSGCFGTSESLSGF